MPQPKIITQILRNPVYTKQAAKPLRVPRPFKPGPGPPSVPGERLWTSAVPPVKPPTSAPAKPPATLQDWDTMGGGNAGKPAPQPAAKPPNAVSPDFVSATNARPSADLSHFEHPFPNQAPPNLLPPAVPTPDRLIGKDRLAALLGGGIGAAGLGLAAADHITGPAMQAEQQNARAATHGPDENYEAGRLLSDSAARLRAQHFQGMASREQLAQGGDDNSPAAFRKLEAGGLQPNAPPLPSMPPGSQQASTYDAKPGKQPPTNSGTTPPGADAANPEPGNVAKFLGDNWHYLAAGGLGIGGLLHLLQQRKKKKQVKQADATGLSLDGDGSATGIGVEPKLEAPKAPIFHGGNSIQANSQQGPGYLSSVGNALHAVPRVAGGALQAAGATAMRGLAAPVDAALGGQDGAYFKSIADDGIATWRSGTAQLLGGLTGNHPEHMGAIMSHNNRSLPPVQTYDQLAGEGQNHLQMGNQPVQAGIARMGNLGANMAMDFAGTPAYIAGGLADAFTNGNEPAAPGGAADPPGQQDPVRGPGQHRQDLLKYPGAQPGSPGYEQMQPGTWMDKGPKSPHGLQGSSWTADNAGEFTANQDPNFRTLPGTPNQDPNFRTLPGTPNQDPNFRTLPDKPVPPATTAPSTASPSKSQLATQPAFDSAGGGNWTPGGDHPTTAMDKNGDPVTTPQQAQGVFADTTKFIKDKLVDPANKQVQHWTSAWQKNEPLTPDLVNTVAGKLQASGMKPEDAIQQAKNTDWGSGIAMGLGLGLGTIGLLHSMTSEHGGIGGWLMALLGLGAGAGAMAYRGHFGEQAQQAVQGGVHSLMGHGPKGMSTMGAIAAPFAQQQIRQQLQEARKNPGFWGGQARYWAPEATRAAEKQKIMEGLKAHPMAGMLPQSDHEALAEQALAQG